MVAKLSPNSLKRYLRGNENVEDLKRLRNSIPHLFQRPITSTITSFPEFFKSRYERDFNIRLSVNEAEKGVPVFFLDDQRHRRETLI